MSQAPTPVPTPLTLTGGCLCGALRYTVTTESDEGYYCHCRMCQLAFGNTRVPWFNVFQRKVVWQGEPRQYASSTFARRGFCGNCGTPLSFAYVDSERMDLAVGSLDDPNALRPVSHFGIESIVPRWHAEDGLPGERLDASERLAKRWKDHYGADVVPGVEAARAGG
ncbi:GFA family protein [Piscinibacter defluvii]|uniref:GFA family protein n=1 Tax=Piscinibacter defluvii TaxID=1796922 RepID=UPI000FDE77D5|nr:GFA family protein [Piscinibacter defluvii]